VPLRLAARHIDPCKTAADGANASTGASASAFEGAAKALHLPGAPSAPANLRSGYPAKRRPTKTAQRALRILPTI
jgi:hypothetical protein